MRHIPNLICLVRILLVWPTLDALFEGRYVDALILFAIAAVSDGLDGFLAKRFGWTSQLGKFLDPLADKMLLVGVLVVSTWLGWIPVWFTAIAVARDVTIGLGSLIFTLWFGPLQGRPTIISKVNTLLQILVVVAAILRAASGFPPAEVVTALAAIALVTTLVSGADYVSRFVHRAWHLPSRTAV